MAEYIEREELIKSFNCNGGIFTYGKTILNAIISRINMLPTADVVEVEKVNQLLQENQVLKEDNETLQKYIEQLQTNER